MYTVESALKSAEQELQMATEHHDGVKVALARTEDRLKDAKAQVEYWRSIKEHTRQPAGV